MAVFEEIHLRRGGSVRMSSRFSVALRVRELGD